MGENELIHAGVFRKILLFYLKLKVMELMVEMTLPSITKDFF